MKHNLTQNTDIATKNIGNSLSPDVGKGSVVLAKVLSGRWVKRRVWSVGETAVYLCSERLYADLLIGASKLWPIGFPKADVRCVDEKAAA